MSDEKALALSNQRGGVPAVNIKSLDDVAQVADIILAAGWGNAGLATDLSLSPVRGQADWVEDDAWVTAVDVAWNPAWVGTEQRRRFVRDGDRLQVSTPWRVMPNWADRGETRSIISFEREPAGP